MRVSFHLASPFGARWTIASLPAVKAELLCRNRGFGPDRGRLGTKIQAGPAERRPFPSCPLAKKTSSVRRREILLPNNGSSQTQIARPIRSETRATLVASIARGRAWLNELTADRTATTESIAKRERCSARKINKTISLAFLAPELVKAAIEGTLLHGMGVARLFDLPAEWLRLRQVLGFARQ